MDINFFPFIFEQKIILHTRFICFSFFQYLPLYLILNKQSKIGQFLFKIIFLNKLVQMNLYYFSFISTLFILRIVIQHNNLLQYLVLHINSLLHSLLFSLHIHRLFSFLNFIVCLLVSNWWGRLFENFSAKQIVKNLNLLTQCRCEHDSKSDEHWFDISYSVKLKQKKVLFLATN